MTESLVYLVIALMSLIGVPLFVVMALFALSAFVMSAGPVSAVATEIYKVSNSPTLVTIPLFTFAGYMMAEGRSPVRLLRLTQAAFGFLSGGVAIVGLLVCAFFAAFTGASGVTIIALGGLLYPMLIKEGYSEKFSLGLITTSGSLGLLFPPSLPIILYGIVAKVDIDKLFKAGLVPGILLILILSAWSMRAGKKIKPAVKFSFKELSQSLIGALPEFLLPFFIMGGVYSGLVTVTETAFLAVFYVFIMEVWYYKDLNLFQDIPRVIGESMTLVGSILLILCCALGVTNYLVDEEIPLHILGFMKEYIHDKYTFLIALNLFLLVVGSMMDIFSAIIIVVPLIIPIASFFEIDQIHLAIIFLANLEIGFITPPIGINLFISSFRFQKSMLELYRASFPFLLLLLVALLLITYIPSLSLFWF